MTLTTVWSLFTKILDICIVWFLFYFILKNIRNNVKMILIVKGVLLVILIEILFAIPIRGSVIFLILTVSVYTLSSTSLGLFISALMKDQFLATEYAILLSFLPAILLSGSLFDLRSVPDFIAFIGYLIPPTYAVESFRICFLSGGNTDTLLINLAIIIFYVVFFSALTVFLLKRGGIKGGRHV